MEQTQTLAQNNNPPVRRDREIELEKLRLETLGNFLSNKRQKTQIGVSERIILSLLYQLAQEPFKTSEKISRMRNIPFDKSRYKNEFFIGVLDSYIEFGIPLNRKGRDEDGRAIAGYFDSVNQDHKKENIPTHMK